MAKYLPRLNSFQWFFLSALLFTSQIETVAAAPEASQARQIVVLYDERTDLPGMARLDAGFSRALSSGWRGRVDIYRESMDLSRFDSDAYRNHLRDHLRAKYAAKKIDVVVAVMEPALTFLLNHRHEVFPGTPIVFCGIGRGGLSDRSLPPDVTGVLLRREFAPTLEIAARLHPDTERITVVAGTSEFDARLLAQVQEEFRPFENRFTFAYLTNLPLAEVLSQLSQSPPKTLVLYTTMFRDGAGESFVPHEVAERISLNANVPMYGFVDQYLGRGIVGGRLYGFGPHGEAAAGLVVKILTGTKPAELVPIEPTNNVTMFDSRQLDRWKITRNQLPAGSEVRFHEPTLWEQYKWQSIGVLFVVFGQTAIVVVLVRSLLRGRRLTRELKISEAELLQNRVDLKDQLDFESLESDISSTLMRVPAEDLGKQIVPTLRQTAQLLGFDVATLSLFTGNESSTLMAYVWHEPDTPGLPSNLTDKDFPWSARELLAGRDVHIRTLDDFPPEGQIDRATYERYGLKSASNTPVFVSGQPVGVLSLGSFRKELSVSPQLVERQRALGNIFGNALVRARSEIALRESEERMLLATEAAQLGMWMWDIPHNTVWITDKLRELLGFGGTDKVTYEGFLMRVHDADRKNVDEALQRALAQGGSYHSDYRVVHPDGSLRWLAGSGRVKSDSTGAPVLMLGVSMDITERHRVEEESREVSSKLITAQEDERKRIARDLHDDLNQRLAMLSVDMEILGSDSKNANGMTRKRIDLMTSQVKELSSEVHRLSYQLHPAKLDQLGLVAAARTFCREVSAQAGIAVHFEQLEVPRNIHADVALCLYRVLQEALQNSVRHGGAAAIQVKLTCDSEQIHLLIADDGKGFDLDHAMHNGGLGLVSMRERVRQVKGSIQITSLSGKGTRVEVNTPMQLQTAV